MSVRQDPVVSIKSLLDSGWAPANVENHGPGQANDIAIHFGWYNSESTEPQVTVTPGGQSPTAPGTGYSAIDPSGAGPVQEVDGTVNCDCWASRDVTDVNPRKLTYLMAEEVSRIARVNYQDATGLRFIAPRGRTFVPPRESEEPVTFHYQQPVWYIYEDRPP